MAADLSFTSAHDKRCQERREAPRQALLRYIYGRAGRICQNKGQKHLRDFEVVA